MNKLNSAAKESHSRVVAFIFLCLMVLSCSKSEQVREVVSIDEILGTEKNKTEKEIAKPEKPELDGTFISELNQHLYQKFTSKPHNFTTLIDRFSFKTVEKSIFTNIADSSAIATLYCYNFSDSTATFNAFNNWLSCFGANCEEIIIAEHKTNVQESPMWCNVYYDEIIIVKFSNTGLPFKSELKQTINTTKKKKLRYAFSISSKSQLTWD